MSQSERTNEIFNVCKWQWCWLIICWIPPSAQFLFFTAVASLRLVFLACALYCCVYMNVCARSSSEIITREIECSLKMREYTCRAREEWRRGCLADDDDDDEFGIYKSVECTWWIGERRKRKRVKSSPLLWFEAGFRFILHVSSLPGSFKCALVFAMNDLWEDFSCLCENIKRERANPLPFMFDSFIFRFFTHIFYDEKKKLFERNEKQAEGKSNVSTGSKIKSQFFIFDVSHSENETLLSPFTPKAQPLSWNEREKIFVDGEQTAIIHPSTRERERVRKNSRKSERWGIFHNHLTHPEWGAGIHLSWQEKSSQGEIRNEDDDDDYSGLKWGSVSFWYALRYRDCLHTNINILLITLQNKQVIFIRFHSRSRLSLFSSRIDEH